MHETTGFRPLLDQWTAQLHASAGLRVWSVIVTIFGDAILPRGGVSSAATLQDICASLGIGHGALRTALSRLVSDGWLVSERRGKFAFYRLSPQADAASRHAAPRIYGRQIDDDFCLLVNEPGRADRDVTFAAALRAIGFEKIATGLHTGHRGRLGDLDAAIATECIVVTLTQGRPPAWVADAIEGPADDWNQLTVRAMTLSITAADCTPSDAFLARTILLHEWRRLILRVPDVPASWIAPDSPRARCRDAVASLYRQLWSPSERYLDSRGELAASQGETLSHRFSYSASG